MRGLGLIVSLLVAAAIGATAMYFFRPGPAHPLYGGPGNGVVTCPGNASCPSSNKTLDGTRAYQGIMVTADNVTNRNIQICTGNAKGDCPKGFVGYLVPHTKGDGLDIGVCRPTDVGGICNWDATAERAWVVYCANRQAPYTPTEGCDAIPFMTPPNYQ